MVAGNFKRKEGDYRGRYVLLFKILFIATHVIVVRVRGQKLRLVSDAMCKYYQDVVIMAGYLGTSVVPGKGAEVKTID